MGNARLRVHELLIAAAEQTKPATDDLRAWDYGWSVVDYRRSSDARLSGPSGTFRMSPEGVDYFESAVELLLAEQPVRLRWDTEELWGIVGSLVVFLATRTASPEEAEFQVKRLRGAPPSTVVVPAANILWEGAPTVVADAAVFGEWDDPNFAEAVSTLRGASKASKSDVASYIASQQHHRPVTGFATVVPSQRSKAFDQAAKRLEQLCDIALLMVREKERHGLYTLRGAWNRPGVRGLTLDRPTIESALRGSEYMEELSSQPLVLDEIGKSTSAHWYSADPLPMQRLLEMTDVVQALEKTFEAQVGVAARIRLAARWYAEAFWANESDDAVLALGVSLDALIGSKSGLPGKIMRDRYAMLEPSAPSRQKRAQRYDEIYGVRSAIAHGGTSSRISEGDYVRKVQQDVTWTAWRLLDVEDVFGQRLASDLDQLFDQLRWGMVSWPATGDDFRTASV